MSECIHFNLPYGDTSNPREIAKSIAKDLAFSEWRVLNVGDVVDEKILSTKWCVEGWPDKFEVTNEEKDNIL